MKRRNIAGTIADATLPKTPVEIGGKTYQLCFDLGALAEAETAINRELARAGRTSEFINLLYALPIQNLANVRNVFAAAVRVFHPELSFEQARDMLTLGDLLTVSIAIQDAWNASRIEEDAGAEVPLTATA